MPSAPLGLTGTGSQGADLWAASNPVFGATFSLFVKDEFKTMKSIRQEKQSALEKDKKDVSYPTFEELRKEEQEEVAQLIWIIKDSLGKEVKKIINNPSKGITRLSWNLRTETTSPINPNKAKPGRYDNADDGHLIIPGTYAVEVILVKNGISELLIPKTNFKVRGLNNQLNTLKDNSELIKFRKEVSELTRSITGAEILMREYKEKLELIKVAITNYPNTDIKLLENVRAIKLGLSECDVLYNGDGIKASKEVETPPSFTTRLGTVSYQLFESTSGVTTSQKENIKITIEEYQVFRIKLDSLILQIKSLEQQLDASGIPYIKGKDEKWKRE